MSYDYGTAYYGMSGPGYYGGSDYSGGYSGSYDPGTGAPSDTGNPATDYAGTTYTPPSSDYLSGSSGSDTLGTDNWRAAFYPDSTYITGVGYVENWKIPFYPGIDPATNSLLPNAAPPNAYAPMAPVPDASGRVPATRRSGGSGGGSGMSMPQSGGKPSASQNPAARAAQQAAQLAAKAAQLQALNQTRQSQGLAPLSALPGTISPVAIAALAGMAVLMLAGKRI